jgi:Tfp pilus assembly PilM family ATPase/Tfp pilus assembly protein PilN
LSTRTGVELYPDGCRLVEVKVSAKGRRAPAPDVHVTAFVNPVAEAGEPVALTAALDAARQQRKLSRDVWVTIWGLRATQQLLRLPPAKPEAMEALARREARKELAPFESGEGASVAITTGAEVMIGTHKRREVSLVAASNEDIRRRIQPLIDAGFLVRGVVTPALALAALARSRQSADGLAGTGTGGTAAYVAIIRTAICVAIIRDGILLFAREMPWGYGTPVAGPETSIEARLASELKRSILFFKQTFRAPVESVALVGDMPTLRSLTGPLGESLGVPVQTLDSLVGIDAATVPEPAERFRAEVAALRMAIATAAETRPAANLLPAGIRKLRESHVTAVRLALAVAASVLLVAGWYYVTSQTARNQRLEIESIEKQLAILEPDAVRVSQLRAAYATTMAQQAALAAFDSQGPRLARFLEEFARLTPDEIVLTGVSVQADQAFWHASITGLAVHEDAAVAQGAVNALVQALTVSPFAGPPVRPVARRVVSGRTAAATAGGGAPLPPGVIGVEFAADFRLAK